MKTRSGFTLLEIIISLAILALVTVPGFLFFQTSQQNQALEAAAQQLADDIRTVRIYSRDYKDEKLWGLSNTNPQSYAIISFFQNSQQFNQLKQLPKGISFERNFMITFAKNTGALTSGDTQVVLVGVRGNKKTVTTSATGVVEIVP